MTIRLLLDEMYPSALAVSLGERGLDVLAVVAFAELAGSDDATVLQAAAASGRCLVTENIRDFAVLARHADHVGLLSVNGRRWPRTQSGLRKLADALHDAASAARIPGPNEVRWL